MSEIHNHTCQSCGHSWTCVDREGCGVELSAKVNGHGPFCSLCMHIEMAKRHAQLRGMALAFTLVKKP